MVVSPTAGLQLYTPFCKNEVLMRPEHVLEQAGLQQAC